MNKPFDETIVGISTALGKGAISIVRLSGNQAITLVNRFFRGKDLTQAPSHTVHYGFIVNPETKETIDEVLVSVFRRPKTYTREDIVEINCHGGVFLTEQIFKLLVLQGARVAEPGEFTKRAFLNGRIDLTKAEAVMDIIDAENKSALKLASQGLTGDVKKLIDAQLSKLLTILAQIAVTIDYPEYDAETDISTNVFLPLISDLKNELVSICEQASDAQKLKDGINTVIVGRPNVGKSSLLNALLREEKAIVTAIPGTTRDAIEGRLFLGNLRLNLIDTAGIRIAGDEIEKIGINRSQTKLAQAELVLLIFDGSEPLAQTDFDLINQIKARPHLKIVNKSDLEQRIDLKEIPDALQISTYNPQDILLLENEIKKFVLKGEVDLDKLTYISNARQLGKLKEAIKALDQAQDAITAGAFLDLIDIYLQEAWRHLGAISGEVKDDALLDELFSKFCLGK